MTWKTYATQAAALKKRISVQEFMEKYGFCSEELAEIDIQGFLDYFEVTDEDLYMKSKDEALFMLNGYLLDKHEAAFSGRISVKTKRFFSGDETRFTAGHMPFVFKPDKKPEIKGYIDFNNNNIYYNMTEEERGYDVYLLSEKDKSILLQAVEDKCLASEEDEIPNMLEYILYAMICQD